MGRTIPEAGGDQGTPHNQDHEHFKALKEEGRLRPDRRNPKEIFRVFYGKSPEGEVPGDASKYLSDPGFSGFVRRGRMRPAVYGGHDRPSRERKPNEQRGETEPFKPNPAEQQAAERLGKPPPEEAVTKPEVQGNQEVFSQSEGLPSKPQKVEPRVPEVDNLASRMLFPYILLEGINDAEYNHTVEALIRHALETYPGLSAEEAMKRLYDDTQDSLSFA